MGHTRLPCDRDFASIEKYKRRRMKQAYTPDDWYKAVRNSKISNPFEVTILKQEDFYSFKYLQSGITKKSYTDDKEKLKFSKITCFKFDSVQPNIMYIKHLINEEFKAVNLGKKGARKSYLLSRDLKPKYAGFIPLNNKKLENLSQLLQFIPPAYLQFYEEIGATNYNAAPIEEDADLVENLDGFTDEIIDDEN